MKQFSKRNRPRNTEMIKLLDKNNKGKYSDSAWRKDKWMFQTEKKKKGRKKDNHRNLWTKLRNIVSVKEFQEKEDKKNIWRHINQNFQT